MSIMQDERNVSRRERPTISFLGKATICALATGGAFLFVLEVIAGAAANVIAQSLRFPLLNVNGDEEAGLTVSGFAQDESAPVTSQKQPAFYSAHPVYESEPAKKETPVYVEISEEGMLVDAPKRLEEEWNALPW